MKDVDLMKQSERELLPASPLSFKGTPSAAIVESMTKVDSQFFLRSPRVRLRRFPEEKYNFKNYIAKRLRETERVSLK